ncbi:MAG: RNA-directed polymerase (Reverse transcriptase) [Flavipsychrobacter sp.]|jgi:RNA-directed DNA polymerase|nr:RNA-directed polymerase (Reverse transcriptase) [Flavipsychrobacter sp.]
MNQESSLLSEIASIECLGKAWKALNKSNLSSRGLSNISIKEFEYSLDANLISISQSLLAGKYRFSNVRAVTIPKSNGNGLRPLRVGEVKDRIVQKALSMKIDSLLTEKFNLNNECSFAYRRKKNVRNAIDKMVEYYNQGHTIILEADIQKFFDTVNKSELLKQIQQSLPDSSINELLATAVKQEIGNANDIPKEIFEEYFSNSENGIPQGNALSPLLANIYLASFDARIIADGIKMIRYADDFIIMCKNQADAESALAIAKEELENKLHLTLHPLGDAKDEKAKTRIVNPKMHKFSFLSIRFDGKRCWVKEKKIESILEKIKQLTDVQKIRTQLTTVGLLPLMSSLKNTIEGWIAAYHFVDLDTALIEIDKSINRNLYLAFLELDFKLEKKSLEKISYKGKSNEIFALNKQQRINTGIPYCHKVWERMNKQNEIKKLYLDEKPLLNKPTNKATKWKEVS